MFVLPVTNEFVTQHNEHTLPIHFKKERLNELLSITLKAFAIPALEQLFPSIIDDLYTLVPFEQASFLLLDQQHSFVNFWQSYSKENERDKFTTRTEYLPIKLGNDPLFELFWFTAPQVVSKDYWVNKYPEQSFQYRKETEFAYTFQIPFVQQGKTIGLLQLRTNAADGFDPEDLPLIVAMAQYLNPVVLNFRGMKELKKRDLEKELLLSVSNDIAAIRNKTDLFNVLVEKLRGLFPFNDIKITCINQNRNFHHCFIHSYQDRRRNHPAFERLITSLYPEKDGVLDVIMNAGEPVVFSVDELIQRKRTEDYFHFYKETGIKELLGVAMQNGREDIGSLFITSEVQGNFKKEHLNLIKGISSQLCIAVANILANDEIVRHEREKSTLLDLSNSIATIRDQRQLLGIVEEKLRKLIPFNDMAITLYDQELRQHWLFLCSPESQRLLPPDAEIKGDARKLFGRNVMYQTTQSKHPVVFDVSSLDEGDETPAYINLYKEQAFKEFAGVPMHNGDGLLGCIYIASMHKNAYLSKDFNLIRGIADQLSFAIMNILANEQILQREKEKSILLALSSDVTMIRNKIDLHRVINEKLKKILPVSHVLICCLSEDSKFYSAYILDPISPSIHHPDYAAAIKERTPVEDGIVDLVISAARPMVFDLEAIAARTDVPKFYKMNYECGIKEVVITPLMNGAQNNALLVIFLNPDSNLNANALSLIHGVSLQLSTAIANIIANEKIEKQIEEISRFKQQLEVENLYLQEEIQTAHNYSEIIGASPVMDKVFQLVSQVSETQSSVLILGETGTGKELIARALHNTSSRKDKLMVKVNCATLPANLIESELFGHERGSFTGATDRRIGKFELANNSTLFLDEVGELPLDLQVKLLRALQEKEIERVGGRTVIKTDVRIIAATNRNLQKEVQLGNFRSDLYFRLNVFPITIPPLRERKEDIPLLASHFLQKHAKKGIKGVMNFSSRVIKELMAYNWPGNVRELEHMIERSILLTNGSTINQVHLPIMEKEELDAMGPDIRTKTIDEVEREHILAVLRKCKGKVAGIGGAAELLKIPSTTLNSKIRRLQIKKGTF